MRIRLTSLFLAFLTALAPAAAMADTITLKADSWMPFNGDGQSETGYMLDLARTLLEAKGHKVVYVMTPWDKALAEAKSGKCTGVIGASPEDAPDLVYPPNEEGQSVQLFCVRNGSP
ncbi:MAG TPA: hypothetical protein VN436_09820 [Holophaga sp.]|nr:hypothetical protein [Holophaga sp.]